MIPRIAIGWIALVLAMVAPAVSRAEVDRRNLWIALGILPAAYFHEVVAHEASHVAVAKMLVPGLKVTQFAPYPCRDSRGELHLGCFSSTVPDGMRVGGGTHIVIGIAPYILGVSVFAVSDILLSTGMVDPGSPGGVILYVVGMLAPFVDLAANLVLGKSDWSGIRQRANHPVFDVAGSALLVVGMWRLVKHGRAVFRR